MLKKGNNHNITSCLHPKLWRRITYEGCKLEVDVGGNWGASHVGDGDVVIVEVIQRGTRARVVMTDAGVLRDHPSGTWGRNRMRLG